MKLTLPKQLFGAALTIMLTLAFTQILASAQEVQGEQKAEESHHFSKQARKIEGVWEAQVTRRVCATGDPLATFRGMTTFLRDGASIGTNNLPPTTGGIAFGRWKYLGGNRYLDVERFFRYNPDGSFAGVQRITRNFTLNHEGNQFTGTVSIEVFDATDHLIQTGCATEVTKRVE